jgi:hypothetical protein
MGMVMVSASAGAATSNATHAIRNMFFMGKPPRVPSKLARFHAFGKRRPKRSAAGCMPTAPREQTDRNDV